MSSVHQCYAIAAPGIEEITAGELRALGISPTKVERGGVEFPATAAQVYAANLDLRTATRIVVRVAGFTARTFFELERHARKVEWARFVPRGGRVAFSVSSRKSKLYHQGAIEERLCRWVEEAGFVGEVGGEEEEKRGREEEEKRGRGEEGSSSPHLRSSSSPHLIPSSSLHFFLVRLHRDRVTISADSSGELLHRRGYRLATAKAPLRETLAAAMLLASGWDGIAPLFDPFCGSGTIPIEGALLARRLPPGRARRFAFEEWPEFDRREWERVRQERTSGEWQETPGPILGSDRDAGAIQASTGNAERAGVDRNTTFRVAAISDLDPRPAATPGWLLANPPWGIRVGEGRDLRDLYARFGAVCRERLPGWTIGLLSADPALEHATGLPLEERFRTESGGIGVRFVVGRVRG